MTTPSGVSARSTQGPGARCSSAPRSARSLRSAAWRTGLEATRTARLALQFREGRAHRTSPRTDDQQAKVESRASRRTSPRPAQLMPIHPLMTLKHLLSAAAMVLAASQVHAQNTTATIWSELGANSATNAGVSQHAGLGATGGPDVAVNPANGHVYVAWPWGDGANDEIYVKRWDGTAWAEVGGSATGGGVSNSPTLHSEGPQIAVRAADGHVFVVWRESSLTGLGSDIFGAEFNGSSWQRLGPNNGRISDISPGTDASASGARDPQIILSDVFATAEMPIVAWRCLVTCRSRQRDLRQALDRRGVGGNGGGVGQRVFVAAPERVQSAIRPMDTGRLPECPRHQRRRQHLRPAVSDAGSGGSQHLLRARQPSRRLDVSIRGSSRTTSAGRPWSSRTAAGATARSSIRTACTSAASSATTRCPPTWRGRKSAGSRAASRRRATRWPMATSRPPGERTAPAASTWRPRCIPRLLRSTARTSCGCCNSWAHRGLRWVLISPAARASSRTSQVW